MSSMMKSKLENGLTAHSDSNNTFSHRTKLRHCHNMRNGVVMRLSINSQFIFFKVFWILERTQIEYFVHFFSVVIIIKYAKVSLRMFFQKKLSFYVNTRNGVFLLEKESISKKESWFVTLGEIFFYKWIINL